MSQVQGQWVPEAEPLIATFADNFSRFAEEGAALAVVRGNEVLVSAWAGTRDKARKNAWHEDTRVNIFSAGKPLAAAVIMSLVERDIIDVDQPISAYWPEFSGKGKESVTVRQVLAHRSGMSAFHPKLKDPVIFDPASIKSLLEYDEPWWTPGSAQGYSPFLYGWILAELAQQATGSTFSDLFERYWAQPLSLNACFGVPESQQGELADVGPLKKPLGDVGSASPGANSAALGRLMKADPRGVVNRAFTNPMTLMNSTNTPEWRSACIPAANCHASALDLARFYGALASGGEPIGLSSATLAAFTEARASERDKVLGVPLRFGLGFMGSQPVDDCLFGSSQGYGHPGAGGSVGFADPQSGLGFAYVTARLGQSLLIDARAQRLIAELAPLAL
ncbi:serine hydrolase domain-containing protein [uncultured Gilvimarinus sp.]|uniref:serine hydrolase domain-containing protein n=1 Tax=uncultured Gilvimarinus sp. TaxID=1689143 RepID=UPI0030EE4B8C|tara:strand:- start:241 stop:1416 length:1176 start_codon:yes stop_codon:yes gene_type:complete